MNSLTRDYGIVHRQLLLNRLQRRPWPQWLHETDITLYFILGVLVVIDLIIWKVR